MYKRQVPDSALKNTTVRDVPIACWAGKCKTNKKIGMRMSPPPIPTSVPKVPTPNPSRKNNNNSITRLLSKRIKFNFLS